MKIVLFSPQIPQNTGNIVRSCSCTNTGLVLVKPLGFSTDSKQLKRAGLDYWDEVEIEIIDDLENYLEKGGAPFTFFSSKATVSYTKIDYHPKHLLIFGSETEGLAPQFLNRWKKNFATIPMVKKKRCLNLATSAGIVLFHALEKTGYPSFS